jgi:hypothetical protein
VTVDIIGQTRPTGVATNGARARDVRRPAVRSSFVRGLGDRRPETCPEDSEDPSWL